MPICSEYLQTRDDFTLRSIISRVSPTAHVTLLHRQWSARHQEIDTIVAYMRAWAENPPVELPPQVVDLPPAVSGAEVYTGVCAQCHGAGGEGGLGPSLKDPALQAARTDQQLFDTISQGHAATPMIAWGEILSSEQVQQLVAHIRQLGLRPAAPPAAGPSFSSDVVPLLQQHCAACHGTLGGWDASS
jgi:mono/diheme cytochrome c family protein